VGKKFFFAQNSMDWARGALGGYEYEIRNQFYCKYLQKKGLLSVWANQHFENTTKVIDSMFSG
jgi:hypothetical protein